jgi:hypothetical protein
MKVFFEDGFAPGGPAAGKFSSVCVLAALRERVALTDFSFLAGTGAGFFYDRISLFLATTCIA